LWYFVERWSVWSWEEVCGDVVMQARKQEEMINEVLEGELGDVMGANKRARAT
jgi:hypothetical protein